MIKNKIVAIHLSPPTKILTNANLHNITHLWVQERNAMGEKVIRRYRREELINEIAQKPQSRYLVNISPSPQVRVIGDYLQSKNDDRGLDLLLKLPVRSLPAF